MGQALKEEDKLNCTFHNDKVPMETWRQVFPFIREAAEFSNDGFSPIETLSFIETGRQELWVIWRRDTVVWTWITEIIETNHRKVCQVVAAGGTDHEAGWYFWPLMSHWLKGMNIKTAEVWCRPSVARLLKKKAPFRTKYEVLTIEPEVL
jgi:hypothetical protein